MNNGDKKVYPLQNHDGAILQTGLTKREYFAGLAMQGLLASTNGSYSSISIAENAVLMADKLLKQLENETTK